MPDVDEKDDLAQLVYHISYTIADKLHARIVSKDNTSPQLSCIRYTNDSESLKFGELGEVSK